MMWKAGFGNDPWAINQSWAKKEITHELLWCVLLAQISLPANTSVMWGSFVRNIMFQCTGFGCQGRSNLWLTKMANILESLWVETVCCERGCWFEGLSLKVSAGFSILFCSMLVQCWFIVLGWGVGLNTSLLQTTGAWPKASAKTCQFCPLMMMGLV